MCFYYYLFKVYISLFTLLPNMLLIVINTLWVAHHVYKNTCILGEGVENVCNVAKGSLKGFCFMIILI